MDREAEPSLSLKYLTAIRNEQDFNKHKETCLPVSYKLKTYPESRPGFINIKTSAPIRSSPTVLYCLTRKLKQKCLLTYSQHGCDNTHTHTLTFITRHQKTDRIRFVRTFFQMFLSVLQYLQSRDT